MQNNDLKIEAGSLYDLNKQIMQDEKHFKCLTHMELAAIQKHLEDWFQKIEYAMLLCNDIHYYTIFYLNHNKPTTEVAAHIIAAAECVGCLEDQQMDILSIELQENNAWEIWLRKDKNPIVFYLFDYKQGIIKC